MGVRERGQRIRGKRFAIGELDCRVVSNDWKNAEYKHLLVEASELGLAAVAGQFFHIACPSAGEVPAPYLRRPMSIYRVNRARGCLEFLYKVSGTGTRALAAMEPGANLNIFGPLGKGFKLPDACRHVLILARGVGLATMAPLTELAISQGARVTAILSVRSPALEMASDYLREAGAETIVVDDESGSSEIRRVESLIREIHALTPFDYVSTCGSNRQLLLLQALADEFGFAGQVALEQHMGCGIGMCFCCVREIKGPERTEYRRVCVEGPVFDLREAISW
jgi:dihydroorotate dehydrogenase electron transfer subunit